MLAVSVGIKGLISCVPFVELKSYFREINGMCIRALKLEYVFFLSNVLRECNRDISAILHIEGRCRQVLE